MTKAIAYNQRIVLIGTHDLLAAPLRAHYDHTRVVKDLFWHDKLPQFSKYLRIKRLNHAADVTNLDTVLLLSTNIAPNQLDSGINTSKILGLLDLNTDQLRVLTNIGKHIALPQDTGDLATIIEDG